MNVQRLHKVRLDCPQCGLEVEVFCRIGGRASHQQYADSREAETVSIECESGCEFTREQYDTMQSEAEAVALDDMWEEEKGW